MRSRWAVWGAILFLIAVLPPSAGVAARPPTLPFSDGASDVIEAVNSLRAAHGLPPYSVSSTLMGTAQGQADYMASIGSVTHSGPGGASVTQRLLAAGYPLAGDLSLGGFRSENIVGSPGMTAKTAVSSWTGDDIHLHTMLSADLQEIGAGVAERDGVTYYVIDCARPTGSGVPVAYTPGAEAALSGGNDIIVPVAISTPNPQGDIYHEVQSGQSLWQISIAYGVKINDIRQLNGLDASATVIQRGVKLLVKRVGAPTPAAPTPTGTLAVDTATPPPTLALPSATAPITPTPTLVAVSSPVTGGGAVAAIVAVALIASGIVAWAGRRRPI
jgi:uncharacterized protein YkwD